MKPIDRNDAMGPEVSKEALIMLDVEAVCNKVYLDIPYANQHEKQKLDILLPNEGPKPYPLLVFIHGGGWAMGDKRNIHTRSALRMVGAGFGVATINYRLSQDAKWPAQLYDSKAAIRYLRANADLYGYSGEKIAVWGNSAGGHLAAMLATTGDQAEYEDLTMGWEDESSKVDAAILWFAATDIRAAESKSDPMVNKLLGYPNTIGNPAAEQGSPVLHIGPGMPPVLLQHGSADTTVSPVESEAFYQKYVEVCGEEHVYLDLLPGEPHSGDGFHTQENLMRNIRFLDKEFLGKTPRSSAELPEFPLIYPKG